MIRERYFSPPSKILRFIFFYRKCFEKCNYEFSFLYSLYILSILLFKLKAKRRKEENNCDFFRKKRRNELRENVY